MVSPAVLFEAAFALGASNVNNLMLDDVARGKLDTAQLGGDLNWTDLSPYLRSAQTSRGATRLDGPVITYEAGRSTAVLDNTDRRFERTNLAGPYVSGGVSQVVPMVAVRYRATWAGVTYQLWRGFADGWPISYPAPGDSVATLLATDAFKVFVANDRKGVTAIGAGELAGARINRILDSTGWEATARIVDTGDTTLQSTTLAGSVLAELQLVSDTELGEVYMDGAGRVRFRHRHAIIQDTRSATSQATFGTQGAELLFTDVTINNDDSQLVNRARITRVGGAEQQADNAASQAAYLVHSDPRTGLLMQTDSDALSYAGWLVYYGKDPEQRVDQLVINPNLDPDNLYPQVLGRELGDRITIVLRPPGGGSAVTQDVFIRGIQHELIPGAQWLTTWSLQAASKYSFLILDNAVLGKLDSNALSF